MQCWNDLWQFSEMQQLVHLGILEMNIALIKYVEIACSFGHDAAVLSQSSSVAGFLIQDCQLGNGIEAYLFVFFYPCYFIV